MKEEDALTALGNEWTYRHAGFWSSVYRWGFAVITVSLVPYVRPEAVPLLGVAVYAFPGVAVFLSLLASWHVAAEYERVKAVYVAYRKLLGPYAPTRTIGGILAWPIGVVVPVLFSVGFVALSVANFCILKYVLESNTMALTQYAKEEVQRTHDGVPVP